MTTQTRLLTYHDYLNEPESKERREIVDGEVLMAAAPTLRHRTVSVRILVPLHLFVSQHGLGYVWHAPVDVVVQQDPVRVRQPDLVFVSNERADILDDRINGGPDLVVEILSPSNTRNDIEGKLADYANIDVQECWLLSPEARAMEVLRLEDGEWQRAFIRGAGERLDSVALPGLELDIAEFFQGT